MGLFAAAAAWRLRRRRANRLQLRLLAGRRRLLGEEIESRSERLEALDPEELASQQQAASGMLDGLHVALMEREAHLQNLRDLAHMQKHKLTILARQQRDATAAMAAAPEAAADAAPDPVPAPPPPENREGIEDQFLAALQQRSDTPKPPARRRRS